jgi:hypothetical protein
MPNPMTGAGYGKDKPKDNKDKKDVKNYSKPVAGLSQAQRDRKATSKAYRGKDDSVLSNTQKAKMAYQKSYIAKGEKVSDRMRARPIRMGNVTTYEGSLYEKRQKAFIKKMQEMNKRSGGN